MQLNILNFTDQETWRWGCLWISHLSQSVSKLTLPALTYTPTKPLIQKLAPRHCMIWKGTNNTFPRVQPKFWKIFHLLCLWLHGLWSCTWQLHSYIQRWQGTARQEFTIESAEEIRVSWIIHLEAGQGLGLLPEEATGFAQPLRKAAPLSCPWLSLAAPARAGPAHPLCSPWQGGFPGIQGSCPAAERPVSGDKGLRALIPCSACAKGVTTWAWKPNKKWDGKRN